MSSMTDPSALFQDGKVFVHHGRVMRPVNIAMASPGSAKKIAAGTACVRCVQTPAPQKVSVKETPSPPVKKVVKVPVPSTSAENRLLEGVDETEKLGNDEGDLEEGEIVDEEDLKSKPAIPESATTVSHGLEPTENEVKVALDDVDEKPTASNAGRQLASDSSGLATHAGPIRLPKSIDWNIEEDGLIIKTYGAEREVGLEKLEKLLPHRSKDDIKFRLLELMNRLDEAVRRGEIETKGKGNDLRK